MALAVLTVLSACCYLQPAEGYRIPSRPLSDRKGARLVLGSKVNMPPLSVYLSDRVLLSRWFCGIVLVAYHILWSQP